MRPCYAQNTSPESKGESVDDIIVCIFRKTKGSDESFLTLSQLRGVCRGAVEVCYRCEVMQAQQAETFILSLNVTHQH